MIAYDTDIGTTDTSLIQFENVNEGRSYPFEDNVVLDTIDGHTLPDSVISDLHLVIPTGNDAFLANVYISNYLLSACVKIFKGDVLSAALSVTVKRDVFNAYTPYRMDKLSGYEDIGGVITFGNIRFEDFKGNYRFSDKSVKITDSAVSRYQPALLRKIVDPRTGESVSGPVRIDFTSYIETVKSEDGIGLRLAAGAADVLASTCDKKRPVNACGATPVQSINGIESDEKKRIVLWFH